MVIIPTLRELLQESKEPRGINQVKEARGDFCKKMQQHVEDSRREKALDTRALKSREWLI